MRVHTDARRTFYGDLFDLPIGDINVVYLEPNVPIYWHRHQRQDDRLFLVQGQLLVRMTPSKDSEERFEIVLAERQRGPILIVAGLWHGYEALVPNTIVLQFNSPGKWDGTDEERTDWPWP